MKKKFSILSFFGFYFPAPVPTTFVHMQARLSSFWHLLKMALHFGGKCSRLELCNPDQDFSWAQESGEELRPFNFFNKHALNVKL
jgi:hypothetical protein